MALFTRRDRIAIVCIALVILIGWGFRYTLHRHDSQNELRVIPNAVKPPPILESGSKLPAYPIDINTAGEKELETLTMIGTVKAADIIAYRNEHGPFKTVNDIMNVHGIGQATFEKIKDHITVNPKDTSMKQ